MTRMTRASRVQRESSVAVPAMVHRALHTPGRLLDAPMRSRMEARFGRDFSGVRVHADDLAAKSAHALGARAYTLGQHIVFGGSGTDERVLAHELAHTLQQREGPSSDAGMSAPGDAVEREADAMATRAMGGSVDEPLRAREHARGLLSRMPLDDLSLPRPPPPEPHLAVTGSTPAVPQVPPRGPNPAACIDPLCVSATRLPTPTDDAAALARVDTWEQGALACLQGGGAASNASHHAAIVAGEQAEIRSEAVALRAALPGLGNHPGRYRDFIQLIRETCSRKTREVEIEFRYNVAFDNPPGAASRWGIGDGSWDRVEGALAALPATATWSNPRLITFHRAACAPDDLDASGQCRGQGSGLVHSFTGAETNAAGTTGAEITVYDRGLGATPYSRSASTGLSATDQTLRHEVGHVIDADIPLAERQHFFRDILPWRLFSWAWLNRPAPRYPNWQAERDELRALLGFDEAALVRWLAGLQPGVAVTVGRWTCTRDQRSMHLSVVDASRQPQGAEFEYARSGQGEYFAELYALAVSRPQFLHDALPSDQVEWLKRVVFHTPATAGEWAATLAARDPAGEQRLLLQLMRVFTWEQVDQILNAQPLPGGARRA